MMNVIEIDLEKVREYGNNPKLHDKRQVSKIAASIREFGFTNPVLLDERHEIIAGHGRVLAARQLNFDKVPAIILEHLTEGQKRAYRIADNKLTEIGKWNVDLLSLEFADLLKFDLEFDLDITGFETSEIDLVIEGKSAPNSKEDEISPAGTVARRCQRGDIWQLGDHFLICGDALQADTYTALLGGKKAQMALTDPPYNVKVRNIGSLGRIKHDEFAMASGEMTSGEFTDFLTTVMGNLKKFSKDGSLHYIFMDWKHIREITNAGGNVYDSLKNVCVWNKTNGGMGSLYRSKHELCFVYKSGDRPHVNNVELGTNGRYRTNVWDYQGMNCFGPEQDNLKLHPTVKPVALLKDAILDVTRRKDIVLDAFLGSGSTLIACEQTGRTCYGIELEEKYCDIAIRRWEDLTGNKAHKIGGTGDGR